MDKLLCGCYGQCVCLKGFMERLTPEDRMVLLEEIVKFKRISDIDEKEK